MCDVFENPPIQSKVVINPETIFPKLSLTEMRSVSKLLKELKIKENEEKKVWFIDLSRLFKEKNLSIFYIPFSTFQKIIHSGKFQKIPDPIKYIIGVTNKPIAPKKDHLFNIIQKSADIRKICYSSYKRRKKKSYLNKSLKTDFRDSLNLSYKLNSESKHRT